MNKLPIKKIRVGATSVTIWQQKIPGKNTDEEIEFKTIEIEKTYKDKDGNWQHTNTFSMTDLPKIQLAINKAFEFLTMTEQEFGLK